jgi:hypothetical protein
MNIVFHIAATVRVLRWVAFGCDFVSKVCTAAADALSLKLPAK